MEGVTDVVFRHVVARAGAPDIFYTEFANATGWVHAGERGIGGRLYKTDDEQPIVAQIWGGNPVDMAAFARHCAELGFHGIDINMGCPAKSAVKSGGAALIRQPDLAAAAIAAAKTAGLPVSVKTRLGYSHIDEWRDWLTHVLQQDIVTLTIHLRTKKEMSKVPAHWELIPAIKALRDEIAPRTLLVINGDIEDRAMGEKLARDHGIDGVMIGRGVFHNPFCFQPPSLGDAKQVTASETTAFKLTETSAAQTSADAYSTEVWREAVSDNFEGGQASGKRRQQLISLLHYHLDLYDQFAPVTKRPYETLKRFFKIYIRDFDGASDVRDKLMHTTTTTEARTIIKTLL